MLTSRSTRKTRGVPGTAGVAGDRAGSDPTLHRSDCHSKHREVHFYKEGVKVKAVFSLNVKNPEDRDKTVFYDDSGKPTRIEWGEEAPGLRTTKTNPSCEETSNKRYHTAPSRFLSLSPGLSLCVWRPLWE